MCAIEELIIIIIILPCVIRADPIDAILLFDDGVPG